MHAVYGRSQIAKYLPTNVLHIAGRHIMGRVLGIGHAHLIRAALLEAAGLALCGGLLALPLLASRSAWLALPAVALTLTAVVAAARARSVVLLRRLPEFGAALLLYLAFFLVCGAILWLLTMAVGGAAPDAAGVAGTAGLTGLARCVSINALAWLTGFVAVGAAAGVGVREAVLIACLVGLTGAPEASAIALALRVISTAGDALFFLVSLALPAPLAARSS
ncbi:MAG: hypothetical protein ICV73_16685 [Acetobacteraceae bacterium]|nr:hypothetical protein [Acetobacteraceae bacterium]